MAALGAVAALCTEVWAVVPYQPNGAQYPLIGSLPGDQTKPQVAVNRTGGYVVWQDNVTDGSGIGISARRLDANFSGDRNIFRVNDDTEGDQENPQLTLLKSGGAVVAWQGGAQGKQDIRARFIGADNTFLTGDLIVNTTTAGQQADPVLTCLADGSVVVVWSSSGQDGSMQGLYAQRFSAAGDRLGTEFSVNQTTTWNQRNARIAALPNGNYAIVWVNETGSDLTGEFQVELQGRIFGVGGPVSNEFRINSGTDNCSSPSLAAMSAGGFMVAWAQRTFAAAADSWDIYSRSFDNGGTPKNLGPRVNAQVYGDQYAPSLAGGGEECLLTWTSMGQDGSREGVYGRFLSNTGIIFSDEFRVNANPEGRQIQPMVTSDGSGQFLAVWSSYVGGPASFDLYAQRFQADQRPLPQPAAPFLNALSSTELLASWPEQSGIAVETYLLFIDGATTPVTVAGTSHRLTGLNPNSTHSIALAYKLADGRTTPQSPAATKMTYGGDGNQDGLPDDWQQANWGKPVNWPAPNADSDGDGASNVMEFLAGTDPTDPASALRTRIVRADSQTFLHWNVVPGFTYQAQKQTRLGDPWIDLGSSRFANGPTDSIPVDGPENESYYRVIRLR
jgi:hypothetical protein